MGQHWYTQDGQPAHFEGANGQATTLREARKLNLYPSVTTVQSIIAAPQLTFWLQKRAVVEALMGGWEVDKPEAFGEEYFEELACQIIAAAKEKDVIAKATAGEEIHAHLERFVKQNGGGEYPEYVYAVAGKIEEETGFPLTSKFWTVEKTFTSPLGYGGACDLHNAVWTIDHKSKESDAENCKSWPKNAEQLEAYSHGLGFPDNRKANVFIGREDGSVGFYEHKDDNAWNRFYKTLELWQVMKRYGPLWEKLQCESQ